MRTTPGLDEKSKRDLMRGSLDVMVLAVLADGSQYGYSIQKRVRDASGQTIQAGTLYPLLHKLEADGLVRATWESGVAPAGGSGGGSAGGSGGGSGGGSSGSGGGTGKTGRDRKWYTLTAAGQRRLKAAAADWQAAFARMSALILPAVRHVVSRGD